MKQTVADFLQWFTQFFAPDVQINPGTAASATTALQGQFSTIDATTAIAKKNGAGVMGVACILRKSRAAGSALDTTSVLEVFVDAGAGNTIDSITDTTGTTVRQQVGNRWGSFLIRPNASGVVTVAITASAGSAAATVTLRHRTFWTTTATVATN